MLIDIIEDLNDNGFTYLKKNTFQENFGNSSLLFKRGSLLIKIISERYSSYILVKTNEVDDWIELYLVRALILNKSDLLSNVSIEEGTNFLIKYFNLIEYSLNIKNMEITLQKIKALKKIRTSQRLK